jgi:putative transposase
MDFTLDTLTDGRAFGTLNTADDFTRECVAIELDRSVPGLLVTRVVERHRANVGLPQSIFLDNGPSVRATRSKTWTDVPQRTLVCPALADAQRLIEAWRIDYNTVRPLSALDDRTPHQCAESTLGARRPGSARLNKDPRKGGTLTPRSENWGRVTVL